MRKKYDADADVQCPFYRMDDRCRDLICEGISDEGSTIQRFGSRQEMQQQKRVFCSCAYKNCEWYGALMRAKYAD